MKEILKPSGFIPPENVAEKTFKEAVGGDAEDNKEVTITANGESEITPSAGKTSMKKVTATVAVPMDANKAVTIDASSYTEPVVIEPTDGKAGMQKVTVTITGLQ
jgi:hypothetical protein